MIIYNETIIMDETIYNEWLTWTYTEQIPAIMATGYFGSYRLLKVIDSPNEGITCCVQYHAAAIEDYRQFEQFHQSYFHQAQQQRFQNKFVLFNTLMENIN